MIYPLPGELRQAVEAELSRFTPAQLRDAAATLSARYRAGTSPQPPLLTRKSHHAAYLLARLPATYAAVSAVLQELRARWPAFAPARMLDLGAGPGTALWAAATTFPTLTHAVLLERDADFLALGRGLARRSERPVVRAAEWRVADVAESALPSGQPLVTLTYALNELPPAARAGLVKRAWQAASEVLVLVEPGTKSGFANILQARADLLAQGAFLVAPCPRAGICPLTAQDDWCHFAQRLPRTALHRRVKTGALGYEDEKFAYLIASYAFVPPAPARVVRHPLRLKGHVKLALCTPEGLRQRVITASEKAAYKLARKANWGETWPPDDKN